MISSILTFFALFFIVSFGFFDVSEAAAEAPACGDWEPFKETLCYKILNQAATHAYEDAEKSCHQYDATLLQIRNQEEQDFIIKYVFDTHKAVDNVWLGAKYAPVEQKFKYIDGSDLSNFTAWQAGYPKNPKPDHCVQLNSEEGQVGKWIDGICEKKALVVCERKSHLSQARIQELLFELKQTITDLKQSNAKSDFPVGFVYIQLPKEAAPATIWPGMTWTDVSAAYSGVFFRVEGNETEQFGQIQEGNAPRLIEVRHLSDRKHDDMKNEQIDIPAEGWSNYVYLVGTAGGQFHDHLGFRMTGGEVRPRNMAIRIWKRSN